MLRMSRTRTTSLGLVAKLAGMSVNGTTVSAADSAGSAHSGKPNAASPAVVRPALRTSRRVVTEHLTRDPKRTALRRFRYENFGTTSWKILSGAEPRGTMRADSPGPR